MILVTAFLLTAGSVLAKDSATPFAAGWSFEDNFEYVHDFIADSVAGTGWDRITGVQSATGPRIEARSGVLHMTSSGTAGDANPLSIGRSVPSGVDLRATVQLVDAPSQGDTFDRDYVNFSAPMLYIGRSDDESGVSHYVSHHFFEAFNLGNGMQVVENYNRTHDGSFTSPPGYPWMRIEFEHETARVTALRSQDGEVWEEFGSRTLEALTAAGAELEVGLIHAVWGGNPDPDDAYIEWDNFEIRELFDDIGIILVEPADGFSEDDATAVTFIAEVVDRGSVGIESVNLVINGEVIATDTSGEEGVYTFEYNIEEEVFDWEIVVFDLTGVRYGQSRTLIRDLRRPETDVGGVPREILHRSSRRTAIVISEIMYRPGAWAEGRILEFVELYNSEPMPADIGGWRLGAAIQYTFPAGTVIPGEDFVVVAADPREIEAEYGLSGVLGGYEGTLDRDDGEVLLYHRNGGLLLEAAYDMRHPWPAAAAGAGHSLVLARPSYGEGDVLAWEAGALKGGSPGGHEPDVSDPLDVVKINEFLARSDDDNAHVSFIELYNHSGETVDVSGAFLSDHPDLNRFRIPDGTSIPPGGFLAYDETELGFSLSASGDAVYWVSQDGDRVVDAVLFDSQEDGRSVGRYPDGASEFRILAESTFGAPNSNLFTSDIIINEIMFNPLSGEDEDSYVELYNRGDSEVDLSGWRFADGIRFTLPEGTLLGPDEYLVVAKDKDRLFSRYLNLNAGNTVGNFGGRLSNSGERLALAKRVERGDGSIEHVVVNEVTYRDGGRWGEWANRDGSSIELRDPQSDNRRAANWTHSDETAKSEWTLVEHTGVLDHGTGPADQLHILMPSAGHCLIDRVQVRVDGGPNLVLNSEFETGINGWVTSGHHVTSHWHSGEGYLTGGSLRLEASGGGDTGANRVRVNLSETLQPGMTVTLSARARWLAGHSQVLLRLRGNYLEAVGTMHIPSNLGTPGAPNSALTGNAGPAIYDVRHSPALPAANQPVTVTTRAHHSEGLGDIILYYRLDPNSAYNAVAMTDDGEGRDAVAGDGLYTAEIPGQSSGTLVAYYIEAGDAGEASATSTYPDDPSNYEALVRFGERAAPGSFLSYHMWFTEAILDEWSERETLSNRRLPGTLVYGNRVIHNIGARYRGSPWRRPTGFSFQVPRDDRLLGTREFNMNGIHHSDSTGQRELLGYWIAEQIGLPFSHQTYVHLTRNGQLPLGANVFTDIQHIESEYIQSWYPEDDRGELFKIDDWFEFNNNFSFYSVQNAQLQPYLTTGGEFKQARYRWSWNKRSNRWLDDDYSSLFQLVEAVNTQGDAAYTAAVESVADIDQWMRVFAVRRVVADWDGYGYNRGKNAWTYKPADGPWQMILWDLDKGMGADNSPPTASLFGANDPAVVRMYNHPPFRRAYWRAFHDAVNGPLLSERINPVMDANYSALTAAGFNITGTQPIKDWVIARRNYLTNQLNTVSTDLAITGAETAGRQVVLSGTAPVHMKTLNINGSEYPLVWESETEWSVTLPLMRGRNVFLVEGRDSLGQVSGETSVTVSSTSSPASPADFLVINEIMYHPAEPGTGFVEIHNASEEHFFDLSGFQLDGLDFNFEPGTLVGPGGFLLVVRNRVAFQNVYGTGLPIAGEYEAAFPRGGDRLRLVRPATETAPEWIIDEAYFLPALPWPPEGGTPGLSFQRVDPAQGAEHPGNWAVASPSPGEPNSVQDELPPFAALWINELQPVNTGAVIDSFGEANPWVELYYAGPDSLSLDGFHLSADAGDLTRWAFPEGAMMEPGSYSLVWLDGQPDQAGADEWHTDFTIGSETGALFLSRELGGEIIVIDATAYDGLPDGHSIGRYPDGMAPPLVRFSTPTPAAPNAVPLLSLLHYWNFNDSDPLSASYTVGNGVLSVDEGVWGELLADDGQGFAGVNARLNDPAGKHLRLNYPLVASVTMAAPTTGHQDVVVRYETRRSGEGAGLQIVEYSVDGVNFTPFTEIFVTETPVMHTIDFGAVTEAADNPDFAVRIRFEQGDGGTQGNNRFDNLTVEAGALSGEPSPPAVDPPSPLYKLVEQGEPIQIDLAEVFTSTDGMPVEVTVNSEQTAVAGLSVVDDLLTVDPLMRGDALVELTADNHVHPPVSVSFRVLVYPAAHALDEGTFVFNSWSPDEPDGSYPEHMLFLQSDRSDTAIDTPLEFAYRIPPDDAAGNEDTAFPYRAGARTRINGLGDDGIAFINTGRGRDLGGALLALDTRNVEAAPVGWLAGTVLPNERIYAIRLQYRVGKDGDFGDVLDGTGQPVEYVRNAVAGHSRPMESVVLPSDALGEEYVQVLWRYYRVSGDSGPRAQLRLGDILVANTEPGTATALAFTQQPPVWSQSGDPLPLIMVSMIDNEGLVDTAFEGVVSLALSGHGEIDGGPSAEAEGGVAVFDGLSIDGAGVFTLTASTEGLDSVESDSFNLIRVSEDIMPRYMQGNQDENNDNNDRVPFAFRLSLEGLKPGAEYRYGNRVVTQDDPPDQNGAGNAILLTGPDQDWVRNTDSPRFRQEDYASRHLTFTTDEAGSYTGWFVTEPTGNRRFEPGNTVFIRLLLNDGDEGEELFHYLTTRGEIQVIAFGEGPDEGSGLTGEAVIAPRNFVVLYDNEEGVGRPLGATPVEITGSETDSRYAAFYDEYVAANQGIWGSILPNNLATGLQRIEERGFDDGSVERVYHSPEGFAGTVRAGTGLAPVNLSLNDVNNAFVRFDDWREAMFENPDSDPEQSGPDGDPSGQGVSNLLRYAFGLGIEENPQGALPRLIAESGDRRLAFPFFAERTDIVYLVEASLDLEDWSETVFDSRIDDSGTVQGILEIELVEGAGQRKFYRVRILME